MLPSSPSDDTLTSIILTPRAGETDVILTPRARAPGDDTSRPLSPRSRDQQEWRRVPLGNDE